MITRRNALATIAAPLIAGKTAAQTSARPNFVFILVDDLRWDSLGCTGLSWMKTPHIDRIAHEGITFRNAFVTTPLCSPARGSFLTGHYVHHHGVKGNGDSNALSHQLITFPALLQKAGYDTGFIGKWHMGNDATPRPGMRRWVSFKGQGQYNDPPLNIDGKEVVAKGYVTDILSSHGADFVREKRDKPFCLYLAHKAIHGPFQPAERHKDLFKTEPLPARPNMSYDRAGKTALLRPVEDNRKAGAPAPPSSRPHEEIARDQLRCMASVDDGVGEIIKALEETKQLDNTVFVFTSDNGYFWGEHGLGDKRWAYEESIRIPLLVRYPPLVGKGVKSDAMVLNIDIAPTFLHLARVEVPHGMHGRSFKEPMRGNRRTWRTSFVIEYFAEPNYPRTPTWNGLRTTRYKYIRYPELPGADEMYDLVKDPYEKKNIAADTAAKPTRDRLKKELDQALVRTA
ncbi:MAG: sulfatase [Acidobacteriota bacterium]